MNKTLLASAVALSLASASAQAITLYDQGGTKVDHYGRLQLQLKNADGDNEIEDNGSRLGFRITHQIDDNLTAFGRVEFRFDADEREENTVFNDLRNSYIGLRGGFGKLTVGNFDSLYYSAVSSVTDIFEDDGYRALVEGGHRARGDMLAYETNDLGGFNLGVAARHYANVGANNDDEEWNLHGYVQFTGIDNLTLALGVDQNNEDTGAARNTSKPTSAADFDPIIGASAVYRMDALTGSLLVEKAGDWTHLALGVNFDYGQGDLYAGASLLDDGDDSGMDFAVGANYKFTRHFRTYAEVAVGNDDVSAIGDQTNVVVGMRLSW